MALTAYQKHVQSILKKGGTMKQAAASWHRSSKPSKVKHMVMTIRGKAAAKHTGGNRTTGKKGGHRSNGFNTNSIFKIVRLVALGAPAASIALGTGTSKEKLYSGVAAYTGFSLWDRTWKWENIKTGWTPFVATSVITWGIQKAMSLLRRIRI